jgi:hypothetical protein
VQAAGFSIIQQYNGHVIHTAVVMELVIGHVSTISTIAMYGPNVCALKKKKLMELNETHCLLEVNAVLIFQSNNCQGKNKNKLS